MELQDITTTVAAEEFIACPRQQKGALARRVAVMARTVRTTVRTCVPFVLWWKHGDRTPHCLWQFGAWRQSITQIHLVQVLLRIVVVPPCDHLHRVNGIPGRNAGLKAFPKAAGPQRQSPAVSNKLEMDWIVFYKMTLVTMFYGQ